MNDDELERQWRARSTELPSRRLDEAIRTAAQRAMRRRPAWQRYAPLAAAASVGVIALLLVRQTPNPAPARDVPVAREALESSPAPVSAAPSAPFAAAPEVDAAESLAERSRVVSLEKEQQAAMTAQGVAEASAHDEAPASAKALARAEASAPPDARAPAVVPAPAVTDQAIDGLLPKIEALVKADAARRTGIKPEEATIVAVEAVTWSDGALGCRTPGELAIQVLTPGYRVEVDAAGTRLVYHTDMHAQIRVCERISVPDVP